MEREGGCGAEWEPILTTSEHSLSNGATDPWIY